ncbi:MAG: hypothetical protein ACYC8V_05535 [Caulobacteraceae bacterium]
MKRAEAGYALVAAVVGVAAFAYLALMVLAADRGALVGEESRLDRARLDAAADAGLVIAVHGLANEDTARWSIDGRPRPGDFDGVALSITIEDERAKAPLDNLDDAQAHALFEAAGAAGERLDALVAEFRDWQLADEDVAPGGVTSADYAGLGVAPRHDRFRTVGELMALKDMDRSLFFRLAPSVTVFFGESGPFDQQDATPVALAAMAGSNEAAAGGESAGGGDFKLDQLDLGLAKQDPLVGRPLTVRVVASRARGRAERTAIVEFTGVADRPYWVRYAE